MLADQENQISPSVGIAKTSADKPTESVKKKAAKAKKPKVKPDAAGQLADLDPRTLEDHPALELVTVIPEVARLLNEPEAEGGARPIHKNDIVEAEEGSWNAFVQSLSGGVIERLKVIEGTNIVCDGRHRRLGSIARDLSTVPVEYVTAEEAERIIDATVAGKRNFTKGAKAYFAICRHPEMASKKAGQRTDKDSTSALSAEVAATKYGVSIRLIGDAVECYKGIKKLRESKSEKKKRLAADLQAQIWAGIGLGSIVKALPKPSESDAPPAPPKTTLNPAQAAQQRTFTLFSYLRHQVDNIDTLKADVYLLGYRAADPETEVGLCELESELKTMVAVVSEAKEKAALSEGGAA